MKAAVAFFIFKRPDCTRRVWDEIRKARPPVLLIIADGPRDESERLKCEETRAIVEKVDWPCDVRRNYSNVNMGCRDRMATGLDWVFEQVEEAIIFEDDCVPDQTFFSFCDELLERYRDDARVMHISGGNFLRGRDCGPWSYYFSKYTECWGWATWRRAWKHFDLRINSWPVVKSSGLLESVCENASERWFWTQLFDRQHRGASNAWDYSWLYTCWVQRGVSILPSVNLVTNIGIGEDATHTQGALWFINLPTGVIHEIIHPPIMVVNRSADIMIYDEMIKPSLWVKARHTILNPWTYSAAIRRMPIVGTVWARWRQFVKRH